MLNNTGLYEIIITFISHIQFTIHSFIYLNEATTLTHYTQFHRKRHIVCYKPTKYISVSVSLQLAWVTDAATEVTIKQSTEKYQQMFLMVACKYLLLLLLQHCVSYRSTLLHCVSKNIPDIFSYNLRKHCRIFIIFGRNITKNAINQKMLYFSTSPD